MCSATVTLMDDESPSIDCSNIVLSHSADAGECSYQASGNSLDPDWDDNCSATLSHDYAPAPSSHTLNGAILPLGATTVTWTAVDAAGNASTCSATVTVEDDDAPSVTDCPADITASNDAGQCGAVVTYDAPVFSDNCGGASLPGTLVAGLPSGAFFPAGGTIWADHAGPAGMYAEAEAVDRDPWGRRIGVGHVVEDEREIHVQLPPASESGFQANIPGTTYHLPTSHTTKERA